MSKPTGGRAVSRSNAKETTTPDVGFHRTLRLANNNVSGVGQKVYHLLFFLCSLLDYCFGVCVIRTTTF